MKVEVDASTCTGCAVCSDLVPEVFELTDDMISVVKTPEVPDGLEDKVQEAADSCPVTCITIS
ncbi:MAG TPA: ferredoxin [Kiritimatiellia bacterium]|nr:ferredoxin [Kiritimatiellia bacterium]HMO99981.1 ferredoxin [Kiritimatiellia bacterium]HMP96924.1 ferredoxin [Kiritimatiellia bacterium]